MNQLPRRIWERQHRSFSRANYGYRRAAPTFPTLRHWHVSNSAWKKSALLNTLQTKTFRPCAASTRTSSTVQLHGVSISRIHFRRLVVSRRCSSALVHCRLNANTLSTLDEPATRDIFVSLTSSNIFFADQQQSKQHGAKCSFADNGVHFSAVRTAISWQSSPIDCTARRTDNARYYGGDRRSCWSCFFAIILLKAWLINKTYITVARHGGRQAVVCLLYQFALVSPLQPKSTASSITQTQQLCVQCIEWIGFTCQENVSRFSRHRYGFYRRVVLTSLFRRLLQCKA